jgi:hypothetical protein
LPSLSNSSWSPLLTPSIRRTSRGTVICPLLVIVARFCIFTPVPYFITTSLPCPAPGLRTLRTCTSWRCTIGPPNNTLLSICGNSRKMEQQYLWHDGQLWVHSSGTQFW